MVSTPEVRGQCTAPPTHHRFHGQQRLQLTATQATRYEPLPLSDGQLTSYIPRQCVRISDLPSVQPVHGEVDTVGVVISLTSSSVPSGERWVVCLCSPSL